VRRTCQWLLCCATKLTASHEILKNRTFQEFSLWTVGANFPMDDFGILVDPYVAFSQRRLLWWNFLGMKNGRVWNLDVVTQ
jgi:hypothetical protein